MYDKKIGFSWFFSLTGGFITGNKWFIEFYLYVV